VFRDALLEGKPLPFDVYGAADVTISGILAARSVHEGGAIYSQIDLCLREAGFLLFNLFKPRSNEDGMLIQANAIFVHAERLEL